MNSCRASKKVDFNGKFVEYNEIYYDLYMSIYHIYLIVEDLLGEKN